MSAAATRSGWTSSDAAVPSVASSSRTAAAAASPRPLAVASAEQHDEVSSPLIESAPRNTARRRDVPSPSASPPLAAGVAATPAASAVPALMLLPRPPDSARPSTSAATSKPAQTNAAATARPNTAATTSSSIPKPQPPPGSKPAPISTAAASNSGAAGAAGSSSGAVATPAASPGGTGAPAVSHYSVGKTIGEGTFGKVKCWGRGTPLMLFDGRVKNVEDIVAGDRLMGDDSTVRVVREGSVVRGTGPMWSIRSADPTRLAWQCNELHILVVKFNQPPSAVKSRQAARLPYFFRTIEMVTDDTTVSGLRVRGRTLSFASRAEAQVRRDALAATVWQPLVWECTPPELLACPRWVQRAASMFQPSLVHFPPLRGDLRHTMEKLWKRPLEEQDILDTAWVLGLWLSSGSDRKLLGHNPSVEFEHSTLGLQMVAVAATNSGIIQSHCDEAVLRKWEAWHAMAYKDMHDGSAGANFDMLLAALELRSSDDHSKLLPQVLLQESVNVRRHLLAGLLDGAGTYDAQRRLYEVSLSPLKSLREAVVHLMRGLGFVTGGGAHAVDEEGTSRTDPHDSTCSLRVTMSGEHMELLPLVQESKRAHAAASAASSWSDVDVRCQGFTCTPVGSGDFFGFELEGGSSNRRCLLGDFVVSHNSGIHKLTGLPVAIKILEKERIVDLADVERVKREIHILTRVRHPNVIRLYEVIDSPRHIFLIMEFVKGGELFDYIVKAGRVQDEQACRIFHHILNGVDYVHNKNIIHRDLKPENLLLDAETGIKIVDFGLGNVVKGGRLLKTACGSPCYAAPEMIGGKKYVGPGVDCWSLGVILFALLAGYLPFEDANTARLYEKIMGGEYEVPDCVSEQGKDLIAKLLNTDPRKRYNAEQVRRHPWYARLHTSTDPVWPGESTPDQIPVVPGPQASGRRVKHTRGGHAIDDEEALDAGVLSQMVGLGYVAQAVAESVERKRHDHLAATYHLLHIKKQMDLKAAGKTASASAGTTRAPPAANGTASSGGGGSRSGGAASSSAAPVPRIPTYTGGAAQSSGGGGAPMVPSAPVAVHHHQHPVPPAAQKPAYLPQRPSSSHNAHPNATFMQTQPLPSSNNNATAASGGGGSSHHPVPPSSARVQSAGTVRPSAPVAPPASARPTTSYVHKPPPHSHHPQAAVPPHHHAVHQNAWGQEGAQGLSPLAGAIGSSPTSGSSLGVANGINGGTGVNAYMQHYQTQQQQQQQQQGAALYGQPAPPPSSSAYGYSSARPPSGSPTRTAPKSAGSARGPGPGAGGGATIATPKYARASSGGGGRAARAAAQHHQQLSSTMPYPSGGSATYRAGSDAAGGVGIGVGVGGGGGPILAVGPATGRPMTSRITGSTGGVSHRLYLPPQEKAAQELATAAAMAAAAAAAAANLSRPSSGTGTRPSSSYHHVSRPGTSHRAGGGGGAGRPPSAAGGGLGLLGSSGGGSGMGGGLSLGISPGMGGSNNASATAGSLFSPQLAALSFKPARAILEELQRVLANNGLQCTLLPPSSNAGGGSGASKLAFGDSLASMSISGMRAQTRGLDDSSGGGSSSSTTHPHVLECRQGNHRFQFHVTPRNNSNAAAAARIAMELDAAAADRPSSAIAAGGGGQQSFSIRIKRVLGDAQTFRDMCAKLLPQLKL